MTPVRRTTKWDNLTAVVAQRKSKAISKHMYFIMFQLNFINKNKQWAGFGPQANPLSFIDSCFISFRLYSSLF